MPKDDVMELGGMSDTVRAYLSELTKELLLDPAIIADVGEGMATTYHTTTSVDEAESVVLAARVNELVEENAKLRELACGLLTGYECGHGELCEGCSWDGVGDDEFRCPVREEARELGVEVSDA